MCCSCGSFYNYARERSQEARYMVYEMRAYSIVCARARARAHVIWPAGRPVSSSIAISR